ncbi:MAG TPA: amidase family protein [Candidatus Nanoarchaeia archaeon]|nr:amidase family protein [Candidatus Nanoarchaeia archaeon]
MKALEFIKQVQEGKIDIIKHTEEILDEAENLNSEYNYFNIISREEALRQATVVEKLIAENSSKKLLGLPVSVKDCICVRGVESRAGSKVLEGYVPLFDAVVVKKLREEGAIIIGKTSQDEFGFGSFSTNVGIGFGIPKNPFDKERSCGGSSGGSAGFTKMTNHVHVGIAESTGGSIVNPASFCGVIGICPTYGRVSRYGLIDYANSLDKIGVMGKNLEDSAFVLEKISGYDKNDSTSANQPVVNFHKFGKKIGNKKFRIGVIKEFMSKSEGVDKEIQEAVWKKIKKLESEGMAYEEVSLPINFKYGVQTYYLIAMAEASTNLAKYCGMRYGYSEKLEGNFNDFFTKTRTNSFGKEAKRRIIIGTFVRMAGYRDQYYGRALSVRKKIVQEYKKLFGKFDCLVSPTMPFVAPKFDEIKKLTPLQNYMADIMTVGPNLAGLPHISINAGEKEKMPVGMQIIADHFKEKEIFDAASVFENA